MLSAEHAAFLEGQGVPAAWAEQRGIRTVSTVAELPEEFAWAGARGVPAIAFPWDTPSGRTVLQLRPDKPVIVEGEDRPRKYLWPKGVGSAIGVARHDTTSGSRVLFVEGTKQALAVAHALEVNNDPGSVYAIAGCSSWSTEGVPVVDLDVADGARVLLAFDADMATNPDVWDAAERFTYALKAEGAASISYVATPGGAKAGLDDVLGSREPSRRGGYLGRLLEDASDKLPKRPAKAKIAISNIGTPDRPMVNVLGDRLVVIEQMLSGLKRLDGLDLFNYGGTIAQLNGRSMTPVDRGLLCSLLAQTTTCVALSRTEVNYTWPDLNSMMAVQGMAEEFTELHRISLMPVVRPDGSLVTTSGYDEATKTLLILPEDLEGLQVPDQPDADDVTAAVELLTEDWLVDFMPNVVDPANLLALMLTPLVRGLVPLVPMAVIDGLQAGVGKNLLADLLSILVTGGPGEPLPYANNDEETRKVITSAFRSGAALFCFDEAHQIEGASLARAITSVNYADRVLGSSNMSNYPNNVTWLALGNQVVVNGDMSRRVYRIALHSAVANPMDRSAGDFAHPDIREWTMSHRAEIVTAMLVLIRSWYAGGAVQPAKPVQFGSFERWASLVGGVLWNAGVKGFLENLVSWREETDFDRTYWSDHLKWLRAHYADASFTVREVVETALLGGADVDLPPRLDDPQIKGYARLLGQAYSRQKNKTIGELKLVQRVFKGHRNVVKWSIIDTSTN